ncbi:MAG TPA: hypothetical protein PK596_10975, partial [Bacteroidales bacterium]|nr:hypothetical protein [Bacteroidales bacterium]HQL46627.1 hypothetical protein [Bacteroidales bacterium]
QPRPQIRLNLVRRFDSTSSAGTVRRMAYQSEGPVCREFEQENQWQVFCKKILILVAKGLSLVTN